MSGIERYSKINHCIAAFYHVMLVCGVALASSDDVDDVPGTPVVATAEISEEQFEQRILQGNGNAGRDRIKARMRLRIDDIDRVCELTEEQKEKLALAARGDIKRFFDAVELVKDKFRQGKRDQNRANELQPEIQQLQLKLNAGLFGDKSLFEKTLTKTLTEDQLAKYRSVENERLQFRYRATIAVAMTTLEKSIPLKDSQRQMVMELLVQETQPPKAFGSYDFYYVMHQIGKLPESRLKAILDGRQWELLEAQIARNSGMEAMLVRQGVIDQEEPARNDEAVDRKQRIKAATDALNNVVPGTARQKDRD